MRILRAAPVASVLLLLSQTTTTSTVDDRSIVVLGANDPDHRRGLRRGGRERDSSHDLVRRGRPGHARSVVCEEENALGENNDGIFVACAVTGDTMGKTNPLTEDLRSSEVGPWAFVGGNHRFVLDRASSGFGSLWFDRPLESVPMASIDVLGARAASRGVSSVSYDLSKDDDDDDGAETTEPFFSVRVGVAIRRSGSFRTDKCYFEFTPVAEVAQDENGFVTFGVDGIMTRTNEAEPSAENCPSTIHEIMTGSSSSSSGLSSVFSLQRQGRKPRLFSVELVGRGVDANSNSNNTTSTGGCLDNVAISFPVDDDEEDSAVATYRFDMEPGPVTVFKPERSGPTSRFISYSTGWYVRSDSRVIRFTKERASIGLGSIMLSSPEKKKEDTVETTASLNVRRVFNGGVDPSNLVEVAYDAVGDLSRFSLRLFVDAPEDTTTNTAASAARRSRRRREDMLRMFPDPDSFDCRFDHASDANGDDEWVTTTVTSDAVASAVVAKDEDGAFDCPRSFGDMPAGSTIGLVSIVVAAASENSTMMATASYLDNVVLSFANGAGFRTYDFEAL